MNQATFDLRRDLARQRKIILLPAIRWVDQKRLWIICVPAAGGSGSDSLFPAFSPRPFGIVASLGAFLGLVFSRKRLQCLVLLMPLTLYMFGTYSVRAAVPCYLQPVEWIGLVSAGVLLDLILQWAALADALLRRRLIPLS